MRFLAGYFGCVGLFIVMMGLLFHALVWPTLKRCKKSVLGWIVSAVFGFGMLHSMAVKPGGDALQGPRRSPAQQTAESTNSADIATTTNATPWETTLAFSYIETTPSNVQLTVSWPMGFYNHDPLLDLFIAYPSLTNEWQWTACQTTASTTTNCTFTVAPSTLGLTELPPTLFARVTERNEACETMDDPDGDGVPNRFEFHHGTNPYVPDAYRIETLDCTNANLSTLKTVLANSSDYSIINLPAGTIDTAESIVMPPHPVLLSGPKNGYTVIKSTADLGAFMFNDGQDSHTLIRNVYLDLLKRGSFQVGFWCGGNLPWYGIGASPSFENVVVRTPRPETQYIGWLYYGNNGETAMLDNCIVNALGATNVRGIETGNGPRVDLADCSFLNFPSNGLPTLSRTFALGNDGTTNTVIRRGGEAAVFVDLTSGVDSDHDGYTNIEEFEVFGTDPWLDDSDGDGMTDPEEIGIGTDPTNVYSLRQTIFIHVTNKTDTANSYVYVSWQSEDESTTATPLTNSAARAFDIALPRPETHSHVIICAFHDLNGNGSYDENFDIQLSVVAPIEKEVAHVVLNFGDVDKDGKSDLQELMDGTDPYSANSLRITRTCVLSLADPAPFVTNYFVVSESAESPLEGFSQYFTSTRYSVTVETNVNTKLAHIYSYRDFNRNGVYDRDIEPLYSFQVANDKDGDASTDLAFTIADCDEDSVNDSDEYADGTSMIDNRSYCYSPTLTVTGIFMTTNHLLRQTFFGTNALDIAHAVTTNTETLCAYDLATTTSEKFSARYWEDYNGNFAYDEGEPMTTATAAPGGRTTFATVDLPYGPFDADHNRIPDWWEIATGLSTNSAPHDWYDDTDQDGLINLHEYWTGCDPLTPDGSNTVLSILARSIDDRITTLKDINLFLNYSTPPFERNTNCWAYGINLTCASPYNSALRTNMAGTAISPRHIIIAYHYYYGSNTIVRFCDSQSSDIARTVIAHKTIPNTDITICLLDDPLPDTNNPAKILPPDYASYIGNARGLPLLELDQEEHAIIVDKSPISTGKGETSAYQPNDANRLKYYESAISGDSGDPVFFIYNQTPILMYCLHYGGGGSGPFTTCYAAEIQNAMDELSNSYHKPCEALRFFDFSPNGKLKREFK